jgi:hypothetical protein
MLSPSCKVLTDFSYRPTPVWLALAISMIALGCGEDSTGPRIGKPSVVFIVSGDNQSATVGTELPAPVVVRVTDDDGDAIPGQLVNFHVVSGNGSVFAGSSITNAQGEARERWTLGTVAAQEQTLEARAVDASSGEALVFARFHATAVPDAGILSIVSGDAQSFDAGTVAAESLTVRVLDKYSNPVPNVAIQWQPGSNAGSVNPASSPTRADGIAKTQWTTGYVTGSQTVTASASGVSNSPVQFTGTGRVVPARIVINAGNNQSATTGTRVPVSPSVALKDKNGNACCAGIVVTFAVSTGGGSIVGSPQVVTDASGVATLEGWILGPTPGSNSLVARADTLTPINFSATATAPQMAFEVQPTSVIAGDRIFPAVKVSVREASGRAINTTVTIALGSNPGNATLGGTLTRDVVDGVATFDDLTVSSAGSGYTLVATTPAGGGTSVTSASFNVAVRTHAFWSYKSPMPTARSHFGTAVVNGMFYVFGGTNRDIEGAQTLAIYTYNPSTDTWRTVGTSIRKGDAVAPMGELVYSTNGILLDVYNTVTNTWASKAPLPTQIVNPSAAVVKGVFYVTGSVPGHSDQPVMQAYDPSTDSWSAKRAPFSVMSALAVADPNGVGNAQIYAGSDGGEFFKYDPETDTWSLLPALRVARRGFSLVGWKDLVYCVGGALGNTDPSAPHDERRLANVEVYATTGSGWGRLPPMNTPREALGAAVVGDLHPLLYVFGGDAGYSITAPPTNVNEVFVP